MGLIARLVAMGFLPKTALNSTRPLSTLLKEAHKRIIQFKKEIANKPDDALNLSIKGEKVSPKKFFDNLQDIELQLIRNKKNIVGAETKAATVEKGIVRPTLQSKGGFIGKSLYDSKKDIF